MNDSAPAPEIQNDAAQVQPVRRRRVNLAPAPNPAPAPDPLAAPAPARSVVQVPGRSANPAPARSVVQVPGRSVVRVIGTTAQPQKGVARIVGR